ncbi:MAG: polyprenyl synthetase family protein [Thermoplasmataceae archaeon]
MKEPFLMNSGLTKIVEQINRRISEILVSESPELDEMSRYTSIAGGKRLRPLMAILAYQISSEYEDIQKILDLAIAYELIHTASLVHDDIIDGASMRRGRPSLNFKYGMANAIVVADYLFAMAYGIGSRYGTTISQIMAVAATKLAEGQINESINLGNLNITEEKYFEIISGKTAYFFGAGAKCAAIAANADSKTIDSMFDFAYNVGMAFQITDDILDLIGSEESMGKPVFTDIKHNAITLPIIYALLSDDTKMVNHLRLVMNGQRQDKESIDIAKAFILNSGGIDYSVSKAKKFMDNAMAALKNTKKTPDLEILLELAGSIISRIS